MEFHFKVLPITRRTYVIQKISLGFTGGILSTSLTVCVCMKTADSPIIPLFAASYMFPSSATFYGLMNLLTGTDQNMEINLIILSVHCIAWLLLFLFIDHRKRR